MSVSDDTPWLLLLFSLPAKGASQRVEVWRKLRRYGMLPLRSSGYVLPNSAVNQERMEWLATAIRSFKGQASVVHVRKVDDLPAERLKALFNEARSHDYQKLLHETKKYLALPLARRPAASLKRIRRRFLELQEIDFFDHPLRARIDAVLARAEEAQAKKSPRKDKSKFAEYIGRLWITRPRPGIDRVSSAWLIRRFIDPKARFTFGANPSTHPDSVPFDMFSSNGFGHRGEDCTFETLCKEFAMRDTKVNRIAQIIHDADLDDEKFGRLEGHGLDRVLKGWAKQDVPDEELLKRGMELIEGLYASIT